MSSFLMFFYFLFLSIFITLHSGDAARTSQKIYIPLTDVRGCFRRLNATHQTGCASSMSGNIGVVHYMETEEDFSYIIDKAPNAPYITLMDSLNFNRPNIERLRNSGHVSGILVIHTISNETLTPTPETFSPEVTCPNDRYGLYKGHPEYERCKQVRWNSEGNGLLYEDFHIPIFVMFNETEINTVIEKCYLKFNKANSSTGPTDLKYPLCAAQLKGSMYAVQSSVTCIRRTNHVTNMMPDKVCDPLGDKNVYATVKATPSDKTLSPNSIIVAASKLDSVSMFAKVDPAADSPITDIVVLLAAAHALKASGAMDNIRSQDDSKDIMFALFQGESFDYIGSSRMVYDMQKDVFPNTESGDVIGLHPINLTHLSHFVELNQLGFRDAGSLWIHTDPISRQIPAILEEIDHMVRAITNISDEVHLSIQETEGKQALPPASVQRFIMEKEIPAVVLTDHQTVYTNKFYNSRFDLPYLINGSYPHGLNSSEWYDYTTPLAENLTVVATVIARTLYVLSTGDNETLDFIEANITEVTHMLYCLLFNASCELFQIIVAPDDAESLPEAPLPLYVSVNTGTSPLTLLMKRLLAYYIGDHMTDITSKDKCVHPTNNKVYSYNWMQGPRKTPDEKERVAMCYRSTAGLTKAESPAFEEEDYNMLSGKYSTWTESVWDELTVRIFLIPNPQLQGATLGVGIGMFLVSCLFVYFANKKARVIFNNRTY